MIDKERMDTRMQSDRWSYLWLVIGTLLSFFWRMPLVWWLAIVGFLTITVWVVVRGRRAKRG
jgi:hypothetical protein